MSVCNTIEIDIGKGMKEIRKTGCRHYNNRQKESVGIREREEEEGVKGLTKVKEGKIVGNKMKRREREAETGRKREKVREI